MDHSRMKALWSSILRKPEGSALLEQIEEELKKLTDKLIEKDDVEVRAQIKCYKKILEWRDFAKSSLES